MIFFSVCHFAVHYVPLVLFPFLVQGRRLNGKWCITATYRIKFKRHYSKKKYLCRPIALKGC